jgi:hypothetical protein
MMTRMMSTLTLLFLRSIPPPNDSHCQAKFTLHRLSPGGVQSPLSLLGCEFARVAFRSAKQVFASFLVTRSVSEACIPRSRFGLRLRSQRLTTFHAKSWKAAFLPATFVVLLSCVSDLFVDRLCAQQRAPNSGAASRRLLLAAKEDCSCGSSQVICTFADIQIGSFTVV